MVNARTEGLVQLITSRPHVATDAEILIVGADGLAVARSVEEAVWTQLGPGRPTPPLVVVIDRRGLTPRSFFHLSLMMHSPRWLAERMAAALGMVAVEHYLLWPTPARARYAFDEYNPRASIRWARRVGAMGRPSRIGPASLYAELVYRTSAVIVRLVHPKASTRS